MGKRVDGLALLEIFIMGLIMVAILFAVVFFANWEPVEEMVMNDAGEMIQQTNWGETIANSFQPATWTFLGFIPVAAADLGMAIE